MKTIKFQVEVEFDIPDDTQLNNERLNTEVIHANGKVLSGFAWDNGFWSDLKNVNIKVVN